MKVGRRGGAENEGFWHTIRRAPDRLRRPSVRQLTGHALYPRQRTGCANQPGKSASGEVFFRHQSIRRNTFRHGNQDESVTDARCVFVRVGADNRKSAYPPSPVRLERSLR